MAEVGIAVRGLRRGLSCASPGLDLSNAVAFEEHLGWRHASTVEGMDAWKLCGEGQYVC